MARRVIARRHRTRATRLARWGVAIAAALALIVSRARAQDTARTRVTDTLSYDDATRIAFLYNQAATIRSRGPVSVDSGQTVDGNVAVLEAPLTVSGHITGRVVVIDGDVTLHPGARIDGDLIVAGGAAAGADTTTVGGTIELRAQRLFYRMEGEQVVATHDEGRSLISWFRRWRRRHERSATRFIVKGGTYNRVEGLPILFGPVVRSNNPLGPFHMEVMGIYRSADHFAWTKANRGYRANADMQFGYRRGIAIGADAFDDVASAEPWQLHDAEVGLATFMLHRDYRDYYGRTGARGYVSLRDGPRLSLTLSLGAERWEPRDTRNPFTLFRNDANWRPNPLLDAGRFGLTDLAVKYDTRNDVETPVTGWLIAADIEHGWSNSVTPGPTSPLARPAASGTLGVSYTRALMDVRRYNRVSPEGQLNLRLLLGGWVGGDPLPLERRFSLGGSGTLPGYDFRQITAGEDVLTCSDGVEIPGTPAQCERVALAQMEYRHDLNWRLFGGADLNGWSWGFSHPLQWVLFADAGRGWLVHRRLDSGTIVRADGIPSLGSFKSDVGIGLDAEVLGIFIAKSLTDSRNPVNFMIRLRHRF
jgi:hypothetical protein